MTDGQMMALGIIVVIVLIKWVLGGKVQRIMTAAWNAPESAFQQNEGSIGPVTVIPPNAQGRPPILFPGAPVPVPFPDILNQASQQ